MHDEVVGEHGVGELEVLELLLLQQLVEEHQLLLQLPEVGALVDVEQLLQVLQPDDVVASQCGGFEIPPRLAALACAELSAAVAVPHGPEGFLPSCS